MRDQIKIGCFITVILALLSLSAQPILASENFIAASELVDINDAITHSIEYLKTQQNDDGGIRWVDESSSVSATIRTVLAWAAAGVLQAAIVSDQGYRPMDYLEQAGPEWIYQVEGTVSEINIGRAGQLLTAIAAANHNPYAFGVEKVNLVYLIKSHYNPNTGIFGNATSDNVTDQVWAMLGLAAAYISIPPEAVAWLASVQLDDGSWDDGYGSYLDITPLALMALIASDQKEFDAPEIDQAVAFFHTNQQLDGGWQTVWDSETNPNTTGMILQAIVAAGQNPSDPKWIKDNGSPMSALLGLQHEDGAIGGDFSNAFSTADAILGLSGQPLYDLGHVRRIGRGFEYIYSAQESDGGWGSVGQTLDVIITARVAGWDPNSIIEEGGTPLAFIGSNLNTYIQNGPDSIGKSILGLVTADLNPYDFNGQDLVSDLMATYSTDTQAFGNPDNTWHQALGILGLRAANALIPKGAIQKLIDLQMADGGWEYSSGLGISTDTTALALQALLASGISADDAVIQSGLQYIQSQQLENGGWGDASTTAYAIMALNALGIDPYLYQKEHRKTPIDALFSYQAPSGAFIFSEDFSEDNLMATTTGLLAATGGNYLVHALEGLDTNFAGLVVQADQEQITTACISFDGSSITGLELLDSAGIPYQTQDGFMSSILNQANPQGATMYWSYWHWDGREWVFNNTGANDSMVFPGSIEAWHFTSWEIFPSLPPNFIPHLSSICSRNNLKNYAVQPYFHYYDLNDKLSAMTDIVRLDVKEDTGTLDILQTNETITEGRSRLPIIIICIVALLLLILILLILKRKK